MNVKLIKKIILRINHFFRQSVPAFSLVELSLVLVIIGVLLGAVFKGQDILDMAKVHSVVNELQHIKIAMQSYHDTYGYYPGDDPLAGQRFGNGVPSGNGNMVIDGNESENVWLHLNKAADFESSEAPTSSFGGQFSIVNKSDATMRGHWIRLSNTNGQGLLTPKQAQRIMTKIDGNTAGNFASKGNLRVMDGDNTSGESCVNGDVINLSNNNANCIIYMKM